MELSPVGNTPIVRLESLAEKPLVADVWVKDESKNPTGTHKDRKSVWLIKKAIASNVDTLAILTAGNAGFSLATLAKGTGLRIVTLVSTKTRDSVKQALSTIGADVLEVDFTKPLASADIEALARRSPSEKIWEVTNEGSEAYESIYAEIREEHADTIVCPLGSGELFMGLCNAVKKNAAGTVVIGVHPTSEYSLADKLCTSYMPLRDRIMQTQYERVLAHGTSHGIFDMSEEEVRWCMNHAPRSLVAEPSALVPLLMIDRLKNQQMKIIMISTGRGCVDICSA